MAINYDELIRELKRPTTGRKDLEDKLKRATTALTHLWRNNSKDDQSNSDVALKSRIAYLENLNKRVCNDLYTLMKGENGVHNPCKFCAKENEDCKECDPVWRGNV